MKICELNEDDESQKKHGLDDNKEQLAGNSNNLDYISDIDHPLDISFTKDLNNGKSRGGAGYASDKDLQTSQNQEDINNSDSIVLSDESIIKQ